MATPALRAPQESQDPARSDAGDSVTPPKGLVYPDRYAVAADIPEVGTIMVRPFRADDIRSFEALFRSLTPQTVYLRYFCYLKELPPGTQEQLTCFDHARDIALAAFLPGTGSETMVGDARVIQTATNRSAEFSVLVADRWQGKGIGACLLAHCLDIARRRGIKKIFGAVLPENRQMLALGKKLGFKIVYCPGTREYQLSKIFADDE